MLATAIAFSNTLIKSGLSTNIWLNKIPIFLVGPITAEVMPLSVFEAIM